MANIITKSPYICAPNIMDTPDYKTKHVKLDLTGTDCIKAGSPINDDGKVANDESAIGILLYDCHACLGARRGVVVIDGRIKQDVAAEHSGITISDEAKAAMVNISFTGDGSRMGGGSGLPSGAKPNQYVVTDGEGNAKWEDKLAYTETGMKELLAETSFTIEVDVGWAALDMGELVVGNTHIVTFDGVVYAAECYYNPAGNPTIGGLPGNWSRYPFAVYNGNDGNSYCVVEKAGTHTMSISGEVETIHKLSGQYVEGMGWSEPTTPLYDAKGIPFNTNLALGVHGCMISVNKQLIVGKTYTVVLDGVTYENLVAVDNDPGASIGGSPSGSLSEDVPFSVFNYNGMLQVNARTGNTHDITIILEEETIHPIDKKYIVLTSPNGTKYNLSVADDGTLSAVAVT